MATFGVNYRVALWDTSAWVSSAGTYGKKYECFESF